MTDPILPPLQPLPIKDRISVIISPLHCPERVIS